MTTAVLTASGTPEEVTAKLKVLTAIFPKGATLAEECANLGKLAKRYGLIKEFKENGII